MYDIDEMGTYIRLYRRIANWGWYKDANTKVAFIHCLICASTRPKEYKGIHLDVGEFVMGYEEFGAECGLSRQQTRTAINHLISTNELTTKSTNKGTIVKVINFGFYQGKKCPSNQHTNQYSNQQSTNNQPTINQQLTTNNKDNKDNKDNNKEIYKEKFELFWRAYPKKVGKAKAVESFLKKIEKTPVETMLDALNKQKKSNQWTKDNGQFIPNPTTWLNQERWNDEMEIENGITKGPTIHYGESIYL